MPLREVRQLKEQVVFSQHEKDFATEFGNKTRRFKALMDSVDIAGPQTPVFEGQVEDHIKQMRTSVDRDSIAQKDLYKDIIMQLTNLSAAKKELRALKEANADAIQNAQKIKELKDDNDRLQEQLDRQQAAMNGNNKTQ